ncbi:MAG: outer membrane beta-barrel protein [Bacteroidota bacterium]
MKKFITLLLLLSVAIAQAQTGTIEGNLTDKSFNNDPLAFASVLVKGTNKGAQSNMDGYYIIENVPVGTYELEISFVGYETVTLPNIVVEADKYTRIDAGLGESVADLGEVLIKVSTSRERETALLLEQKKAVAVKESIGAEQMSKLGVSNASTATSKISGVNRTDGSGDIFVRGLGDRYLYTTLNGLPVPSDDIERKNIDLTLFSTRLIQSIAVSKTSSPSSSADQSSGNIDVTTKELSGSELLQVKASSAVNSNVMESGVFDNFKVSPNQEDVSFGIYVRDGNPFTNVTQQSWTPGTEDLPVNNSISVSAGKKFGEKLKVLLTAGQSSNYEYRNGVFRQFRSNFIDDTIPDAITWRKRVATSGLLSAQYKIDDNNTLKANTLAINTVEDNVFEGGRGGRATIFEETDVMEIAPDGNVFYQFIRDQNTKKTLLSVTQLIGEHDISEKNELNWALGYNFVSADEPNRIRNEVNITDGGFVQLGRTGGFQQRKSIQKIEDIEYNGRINNLYKVYDSETDLFHVNVGANYRNKTRDFGSQFVGVEETFTNAINPPSIDDITSIFTQTNFDNNLLEYNLLQPDRYEGELQSIAGFVDFIGTLGKFSIQTGLRYQADQIDVLFDVGNFPGRLGETNKEYNRLYPSVNFKYAINEKHSVRFANSLTRTLPEFKEIAPFEYVSPQGQITRGNPDIEASNNFNFDLKWEFFPTNDQLISVTGFYKKIEDPINRVQDRGSAGIFSYFNSGEKAEVFGLELEGRINILDGGEEDDQPKMRVNFNASRMWHEQDLKEIRDEATGTLIRSFRYKGLSKVDLQGASDWILNTSVNYDTNTENPFSATLVGNYASDRVFALGAAEIQTSSDTNYNDAIVENGFVTLDLIITKNFGEHWQIGLTGRNLLNPEIKRTQLVRPSTTNIETEETVLSYTRGIQLGVNLNYTF